MHNSICIAQTVEELKFILSKFKKEILVVPLDLEVQVFCIRNNLHFLDPLNYLDKSFHIKALKESEKLKRKIKFRNFQYKSHEIIAETFIIFRFNSIFFLKNLIEKIFQKESFNEIVLSGWNRYESEYSIDNYYITEIIKTIFKYKKITTLSKEKNLNKKLVYQIATAENIDLKNNKKNILISNLGYNLFRFVKYFNRKYNIIIPENSNINFLKKLLLKYFFNVNFLNFTYKFSANTKTIKPKVSIDYNNKKIENLLTERFSQEVTSLINLKLKSFAIDSLFKKINIFLVISHNVRGENGYFLEKAHELNINSICVPHGTVAKSFSKYDKIYKKIISDSVIFGKTKFIASQSKIARQFLEKNYKFDKKIINTGNLIFSEIQKKFFFKKKILFAVTLKKFFNMQFLGVEAFYEFLDNLKFLNSFSKKNRIKILVNLHPAAKNSLTDLEEIFPNLDFSCDKIDKALKKVDITLSFSSTAIEDSLYSNVPVILFDRWQRYQHCDAQKNFSKKNSSIYYINKELNLIKCINTIYKSNQISYKKHIFTGKSKSNIKNFVNSLK